MVRLPDGMRDRLAIIAKRNKRSVNAEVVDRLEKSFISPEAETFFTKLEEHGSEELSNLAQKMVDDFSTNLRVLMEKVNAKDAASELLAEGEPDLSGKQ